MAVTAVKTLQISNCPWKIWDPSGKFQSSRDSHKWSLDKRASSVFIATSKAFHLLQALCQLSPSPVASSLSVIFLHDSTCAHGLQYNYQHQFCGAWISLCGLNTEKQIRSKVWMLLQLHLKSTMTHFIALMPENWTLFNLSADKILT